MRKVLFVPVFDTAVVAASTILIGNRTAFTAFIKFLGLFFLVGGKHDRCTNQVPLD